MDKIIFVDFETKICSAWLNTVSDTVWDALGQAKSPSEARQFIGAVEEAPQDGGLYLRSNLQWVSAATSLMHNDLSGRDATNAHPISAITGLQQVLDDLAIVTAADVSFSPTGGVQATNVQAAIQELDTEKTSVGHTHVAADVTNLSASAVPFTPTGTIQANNVQAALAEVALEAVQKDSTTGAAALPAGTTAQRPSSPPYGATRANSTLNQTEWWNGSAWVPMGGGATGAPGNALIFENDIFATADYTITTGKNGMSAGPITVNNGVTITVPNGSVYTVV